MNNKYTALYQKIVAFKRSIKQLRKAHNQKRKSFLIARIQKLYRQLSRFKKFPKLKPAIVGALFVAGLSVDAQTVIRFAAPDYKPFGFVPQEVITVPTTGDFDNDGDYDLLNGGVIFPQYMSSEPFAYYENFGTPENASFDTIGIANPFGLTGSLFLQFSTNADFDNDGDLDVLMGGGIQNDTDQVSFLYAENIGTPESPEFAEAVENPFNLRLPEGTYTSFPTTVDMDNDGDLDIAVTISTREGLNDVLFYKNIGDTENPQFSTLISASGFGVGANAFFSINFADLDTDGDQDMLIGGFNPGNVFYYENIGTAESMYFSEPLQDPFNIKRGVNFSFVNFEDMDADGDEDLFVGDISVTSYYENISINAPDALESNIFIKEDTSHVFAIDDFLVQENYTDEILGVVVDTLPINGNLKLEGNYLVAGQEVEAAKFDQFIYQPNEDIYGDKIDFFTFKLIGKDTTSLEADTMFVNISPVNDEPSFTVSETEISTCSYTTKVVIDVSDIDLGGEDGEVAELTAASDNNAIVENVEVEYNENDSTAVLSFDPIGGTSGEAMITVSLSDGTDTTIKDIAITIEACLGINDLKIDNNLVAFPNPAKTFVKINWNNENLAENTIVKIFDISGRLIQETKYINGLNVSGLNAGGYFVAIEMSGQWVMTKLNVL